MGLPSGFFWAVKTTPLWKAPASTYQDQPVAPALCLNLIGAGLILWSLAFRFNPAAFVMEAAWALVAAYGLIRLGLARRGR